MVGAYLEVLILDQERKVLVASVEWATQDGLITVSIRVGTL